VTIPHAIIKRYLEQVSGRERFEKTKGAKMHKELDVSGVRGRMTPNPCVEVQKTGSNKGMLGTGVGVVGERDTSSTPSFIECNGCQ
jgi:hypothetical protein